MRHGPLRHIGFQCSHHAPRDESITRSVMPTLPVLQAVAVMLNFPRLASRFFVCHVGGARSAGAPGASRTSQRAFTEKPWRHAAELSLCSWLSPSLFATTAAGCAAISH